MAQAYDSNTFWKIEYVRNIHPVIDDIVIVLKIHSIILFMCTRQLMWRSGGVKSLWAEGIGGICELPEMGAGSKLDHGPLTKLQGFKPLSHLSSLSTVIIKWKESAL